MDDSSSARQLNPFTAGGALSGTASMGFFGRDAIFKFVRDALDSTQRVPILLLGQRRIGKSSILRQLPHHLEQDTVCVYFDLQGKANQTLDQVLYGLARAIASATAIALPSREEAAEESFEPVFLARAFAQVGSPRRLVLLLDEFDMVDPQPDLASTRFVPYLGEQLADGKIGLVLVMGRRSDEMSEAARAAILKDCMQKRIGRLNQDEVTTLISKLASYPVRFSEEATARVYHLAAGHPFCTQLLCHVVWRQAPPVGDKAAIIQPAEVDDAIAATLELGTNGMSWIYDGAERPEHRLLLSALAESADPLHHGACTVRHLFDTLQQQRINLPIGDLERAARELHEWDVIEPDASDAYRYVVPLLGAWVRRERPLLFMQREARYANPRAWKNYELGLEALEQDLVEEAVEHFTIALRANPTFVEAQIGVAEALQRTKSAGPDKIVEAWERALELRPDLPSTPLLDALLKSIELSFDYRQIKQRYERITALDNGGTMWARSQRAIAERALKKEQIGSVPRLREAWLLRQLIDPGAKRPEGVVRDWHNLIAGLGIILALISVVVPQFVSGNVEVVVAIFTSAVAGVMFSYGILLDTDPKLTFRNCGLVFAIGGFFIGIAIFAYLNWILAATVAAAVFGLLNMLTEGNYPKENV